MIRPDLPALVLAPMDGITDAPMRQLQGEIGAFCYGVTEFQRVSVGVLPAKVFRREVPELLSGARTASGLPIQVQLLGGDPERMASTAVQAVKAGATAIDLNFGCPAPTVNRSDGGATLLKFPDRIREIVRAVRDALPPAVPISAKLRLGWESIEDVHLNARRAVEGGADWLTLHARTRVQRYEPPVFWKKVGEVRREVEVPVVANGDIWTLDDFHRCREESGCRHFMIGRGALASPTLSWEIAAELGLPRGPRPDLGWLGLMQRVRETSEAFGRTRPATRMKQWLHLAGRFGAFPWFEEIKRLDDPEAILAFLEARTPVGTAR